MENIKRKSHGALVALWCLYLIGGLAFFTLGVPFILDQHEKERDWRADRLCRIYDVCDPKRGV